MLYSETQCKCNCGNRGSNRLRIAICIESSHMRGMGHLFRMINFIEFLKSKNTFYILILNADFQAQNILKEKKIKFLIVDLDDVNSKWEQLFIQKYQINCWLNDRLDTSFYTAQNVKNTGIKLFTIDDCGQGAKLCDGNFASLIFDNEKQVQGRKVFLGCKYLILNQEIAKYRRIRTRLNKVIITLGGSDTYNVTSRVLKQIKKYGYLANSEITVIIGPSNINREEILDTIRIMRQNVKVKEEVHSLIEEFQNYDLAITGGGVTCFEACSSGLPCIIIANEIHEIQIAQYLQRKNCAKFAGYYQEMNLSILNNVGNLTNMSLSGMKEIALDGANNIYQILRKSINGEE